MNKWQNSTAQSIYIHIPFCKRKCNYCAFISYNSIEKYENNYINALCNEISNANSTNDILTIYFGGGTPNLLNIKSFEKIFTQLQKNFSLSNEIEVTVEINPALTDIHYLKELKNLGINRVSIGVQSFNNSILNTLNRLHTAEDALKTITMMHQAEINNYSIDLIYGIFGQTIKDIKNDLKIIKELDLKHISTYGLKIEKNTPFEKFNKTNLPNEELCEEMYLLISESLENYGFKHYEISNFAKENFEAQHNLTYWKNNEYLAFGTAAHGYSNKIRYKNTDNLTQYIKNPNKKIILNRNTQNDIFEEKVFLGLRLAEGINLEEIKKEFNIDFLKEKNKEIEKFQNNNLLIIKNNNLSLTTKGFLLSNYIIGELLS